MKREKPQPQAGDSGSESSPVDLLMVILCFPASVCVMEKGDEDL